MPNFFLRNALRWSFRVSSRLWGICAIPKPRRWCYAHQTAPTGKPFGIHRVSRAPNRLPIPIASSFHSSPLMATRTNSQPGARKSNPAQLSLRDRARLGRHQVAETIAGIVAADAILVGINFQNIFGPAWIVLQRRQSFQPPRTPLVNEKCRLHSALCEADVR